MNTAVYDTINRRLNISGTVDKMGNMSITDLSTVVNNNIKGTPTIAPFGIVHGNVVPGGTYIQPGINGTTNGTVVQTTTDPVINNN